MAERTIRHGLFRYYQPETQIIKGKEEEVLVERMAFHNQTVDVPRDEDVERGDKLGAFWTVDEARAHYDALGIPAPGLIPVGAVGGMSGVSTEAADEAADGDGEEVELTELDDGELVDWLMSTGRFDGEPKPTVPQVVEAAGEDSAFAERLLQAEKTASGDAPRKSVEEGLNKVANPE